MAKTVTPNQKMANAATINLDIRHIMEQLGIPEHRCPQDLLAKSAAPDGSAESR